MAACVSDDDLDDQKERTVLGGLNGRGLLIDALCGNRRAGMEMRLSECAVLTTAREVRNRMEARLKM